MTNISKISKDNIQYNYLNWEHNHGVGFLSQLLADPRYRQQHCDVAFWLKSSRKWLP